MSRIAIIAFVVLALSALAMAKPVVDQTIQIVAKPAVIVDPKPIVDIKPQVVVVDPKPQVLVDPKPQVIAQPTNVIVKPLPIIKPHIKVAPKKTFRCVQGWWRTKCPKGERAQTIDIRRRPIQAPEEVVKPLSCCVRKNLNFKCQASNGRSGYCAPIRKPQLVSQHPPRHILKNGQIVDQKNPGNAGVKPVVKPLNGKKPSWKLITPRLHVITAKPAVKPAVKPVAKPVKPAGKKASWKLTTPRLYLKDAKNGATTVKPQTTGVKTTVLPVQKGENIPQFYTSNRPNVKRQAVATQAATVLSTGAQQQTIVAPKPKVKVYTACPVNYRCRAFVHKSARVTA